MIRSDDPKVVEPRCQAVRFYRFGPFELDPRAGELRKHGIRVRLQEQPLQILRMLVAQPGQPVLREEIQQKLWPNDTVVEFDHGINAAIKRLRTALGDTADAPRYVETLARRGYRFIGAVEQVADGVPPEEHPAQEDTVVSTTLGDTADLEGKTVSHYRVLEKLGSGGMGVVYRAEDLVLGRQVALKFLNCAASDADSTILERFRSEARAAAALNHPHICAIYAIEEAAGQPMIAMELVEGETLAARLAKGPLPFDETLKWGVQLARALDAGHRAGIVHRDFKPANIMLTRSGAKILDFGLAKVVRQADAASAEEKPTEPLTRFGMIVGTPQYMAPEQIDGRDVDARCDVFAFGAVLYEMATGRKAFAAETRASVLAAVLERQPPSVSSIQPVVPALFDRLVGACMAKDPAARKQSLYDVALELEWMAEGGLAVAPRRNSRWLLWGAIGFAVLIAAAILAFSLQGPRQPPAAPAAVHFLLSPPEGTVRTGGVAVSPDGSAVATVVLDAQHNRRLWLHSLASSSDAILPDTEGASRPFWSPDSKSIGFFAREKLRTIPASGGAAQTVSDVMRPGGGTWNSDGTIVFGPDLLLPLFRVPAQGGERRPATRFVEGEMGWHSSPQFLPDGRHFLYLGAFVTNGKTAAFLGSLDSPEHPQLLSNLSEAGFAPPDYLLFLRAGTLMAQRFDFGKARPISEPVRVAGDQNTGPARVAGFSVSQNGVLVYRSGDPARLNQPVWRDRGDRRLQNAADAGRYHQVFLSRDERLVSMDMIRDGPVSLWLLDLATNVLSPLARDETLPIYDGNWSPDSRRLVYQVLGRTKNRLMMLTLGEHSPRLFYDDGNLNYPDDWSPDGKWILGRRNGKAVIILPTTGVPKPTVLLDTPDEKDQLQFSPDGKWIAYNSLKSGQWEVYVSRFPDMMATQQLSSAGGCQPLWRKDGKELFYLTQDGKLMSVPLTEGDVVQARAPNLLFASNVSVNCNIVQYAVTGDGQKFLMIESGVENEAPAREPLHVVLNWAPALQR